MRRGHTLIHADELLAALADSTFSSEKVELPEHVRGFDGKLRAARRPTVVAAKNEREAERAQQALALIGDDAPSVPVLDVKRAERIAREVEAERKRAEPTEPVTVSGTVDIRHGDFRQVLADIEPGSVDAIITDPPYPGEYIPLFGDLAELAAWIERTPGVPTAAFDDPWAASPGVEHPF